ncbi:tumor necrosis factor receptor superfamily member 1A-like [Paroedura picta]|uniref:tumor necrosis factor receptor superfamily member 1A-like n=1 Tax=Paroedura picta TaxID=143630 RepID=UPI004055B9DC
MVPLGLYPALAVAVKLILIQINGGDCLGLGPVPRDVRTHGVLEDKQPFNHSSSSENRQCRQGYYLHPDKTHCCMRCHKGTYVAQDCATEDKTSTCKPCPERTYMDWENSAKSCRGCQDCRTKTMSQVTLSNCTSTQDTVCGCASNYYRDRESDSPDFLCLPCSACHNGTVWKPCSKSSDTICKCNKGFFLQTQKNSCLPCSSCQGEECEEDCDVMIPSRLPPDSLDLTPILSSLVVVFAAAILFIVMRQLVKKPVQKKLISAFSICRQEQQPSPADPQLPLSEVRVTSIPQEPNQQETLLPVTAAPAPPNTQRLPYCIQPAGEAQIPDCPEVLYAVTENVPFPRWKEFVRRLGLSDNTIARILAEERNMQDAQYKMLKHWRQQWGQRATVERISSVLKDMELSGCNEAIQEVLLRWA